MTYFIASLVILLLALAALRTIRHDGYGSRPPPRSHLGDAAPVSYYDVRVVA